MSQDPAATPSLVPDRLRHSEDVVRPSDDSAKGLLRSAARPLEPRLHHPVPHESYAARVDYDPDEAPPARHPSRQMMRWAPPPGDYAWDAEEARPYGRRSYDYGAPQRHDYYDEDGWYGRPYRRGGSVREPPMSRGPPPPPKRPYRQTNWDDRSDDDEEEVPNSKKEKDSESPTTEQSLRLPLTEWMNSTLKNHFVATLGEFVGTTMFLFFAFAGTQVANIGTNDQSKSTTNASNGFSPIVLLYVGISFGFSLMVNVWIFFRISGGLFNPAVTLAMMMVHSIGFVRGFLLFTAQLAGSMLASILVKVLFPTTFNVRTTLSSSTSLVRGVFIEAVLTAELVFTIFMLAKEKHKATFMAPVGIGLALFVAELVGVYYTGGSLNPARSFGPCVVTRVFDKDHWIYWVGPGAGAIAAVGFYRFIKTLEYEMANPGQDETSEHAAAAAATTSKKETV